MTRGRPERAAVGRGARRGRHLRAGLTDRLGVPAADRRGPPGLGRLNPLLPDGSMLQHRPHDPGQVMGGGRERNLSPVLVVSGDPLEVGSHRRGAAQRDPGRFGQQLSHRGRTFAGDVTQPVGAARLVLTGNQSEVSSHLFAPLKPVRIVEKGQHRFRRPKSHARNGAEQPDRRLGRREPGQFLFDVFDLPGKVFQFVEEQVPAERLQGVRKFQRPEPGESFLGPQAGRSGRLDADGSQ
jgi:hypothetical protein